MNLILYILILKIYLYGLKLKISQPIFNIK